MAITNPYIFGAPVKTKEMFFGREDVFAFLQDHLIGTYQDNVVMLYGQRRTGKTSILYQLLDTDRLGSNYVPVLISLEGLQDFETNAHVFLEIARKISRALGIRSPKSDKFDVTNSYFRYNFLDKKVKPLLNHQKLLLMIDEYEVLESCVDNPDTQVNMTLFHQLRYMMQHYDWISLILVGSHKVEELNTDYWKEFTGTIYRTISFLDGESAQELIEKPAAKFSVRYTPAAVQQLLKLSGNHPYFLQSLCRFAYTHGADKQKITKQDVEKTIEPCIEAIRNGFESIWRDLKNDEKVILSTISHLDSAYINISDIVGQLDHFKVNWKLKRIKRAVRQLLYKDALKKTETQQYQSCVPFFEKCVKTYQSLNTLLDNLNIRRKKNAAFIHDPEVVKAENNLKIAEEYVQSGEFEKAEKTFQYVIETHPDYIGSWLRFGKFYESLERWDDALKLYETRLKEYPDSVEASNAIGLLLKRSAQHEEALRQFLHSLRIQRTNAIAQANIGEIVPQKPTHDSRSLKRRYNTLLRFKDILEHEIFQTIDEMIPGANDEEKKQIIDFINTHQSLDQQQLADLIPQFLSNVHREKHESGTIQKKTG